MVRPRLPHQPAAAVVATRHRNRERRTGLIPQDSRCRDRPTGQRRGDESQVDARGLAIRASPSSHMDVIAQLVQPGRPDAVDITELIHAGEPAVGVAPGEIAAAVTGPTPGSVSSSSTVAVFRSTKAAEPEGFSADEGSAVDDAGSDTIELPISTGRPGGAPIPTTICSPSVTRLAMFSPITSAPSTVPPAASSASAIRAPGVEGDQSGCVNEADDADDHGRLRAGCRRARCRRGRRNHLNSREFGRHHRRWPITDQAQHRHQHGDRAEDAQRDDAGAARVRPDRRDPAGPHPSARTPAATGTTRCPVARRRPRRRRRSRAPRRRRNRAAGSSVDMRRR